MEDGTCVVYSRKQSMAHFADIVGVRAAVIDDGIGVVWDDALHRKTLTPRGRMECEKRHEQVWLREPDNPEQEDRARLLQEEHHGVANRLYKRRIARHYAVTMHKRFGRFALETFWVYGVVDEAICEALRATAQTRKDAHQEAVRRDPGYVAAQRSDVAKAAQARAKSRAAANLAARLEAATESPGYCDECWWWASPLQHFSSF